MRQRAVLPVLDVQNTSGRHGLPLKVQELVSPRHSSPRCLYIPPCTCLLQASSPSSLYFINCLCLRIRCIMFDGAQLHGLDNDVFNNATMTSCPWSAALTSPCFITSIHISHTALFILTPVLLFLFAASGLVRIIFRQQISPLRRLRGPPSPSFLMGNLAAMHDQENNNLIARWEDAYGSAFIYHGFFGGARLMITDPVAIAHVLGNAYEYPKPDFVRDSLASMAAGHDGEC